MSTTEQSLSGEQSERPRRLERVNPGSLHGGVCAGLADYTGYDVALIRLGVVALVVLGGAGITLYLAAWLLIPERGADRSIAERVWASRQQRPRRVYAAALLALLVVACSPHAVAVGALLAGTFLLWRADGRPGAPAPH